MGSPGPSPRRPPAELGRRLGDQPGRHLGGRSGRRQLGHREDLDRVERLVPQGVREWQVPRPLTRVHARGTWNETKETPSPSTADDDWAGSIRNETKETPSPSRL